MLTSSVPLRSQNSSVYISTGCAAENQVCTLVHTLTHECARVAHCCTARWRNFSHYCRPLHHYDVWLRVLITEKHWQPHRQHTVYRNKHLEFATEQVGKFPYVTAVDGGLKRFPWVAWFAHPCPNRCKMCVQLTRSATEDARASKGFHETRALIMLFRSKLSFC